MPAPRTPDSKSVRKDVEAGQWPLVWLWTGPESYLKREQFTRLAESIDPTGLNVTRYKAGETELDPILVTCKTLPMLSEKRLVELSQIEALKRGERDQLAEYVSKAAPETLLILTTERGPRDSLNARLEKAGAKAAVFWTPFARDTLKWIQLRFKDLEKTCSPMIAESLFQTCGPGEQIALSEIAPEIEKVAAAAGDRSEITEEDLSVIGYKTGSDQLQAVLDCVGRRDLAGALLALHDAMRFKENDPVRVVALLALRLQTVTQVQALMGSGASPSSIPKLAGIWPKEWPKIQRTAAEIPEDAVRACLSILADADRTLKSSPQEPRLVLEQALLNICGSSRV